MDLFKALTGKNPDEYEKAASILVNEPNIELFKKLVSQDDFLFDFIKNNVSRRIQKACNSSNYLNLVQFFEYYSSSYDTMIAEVLHQYGGLELLSAMKEIFLTGSEEKKAYAVKFFTFIPNENLEELLPHIRNSAKSEYEPLRVNSIELLAKLDDDISKNEAISLLKSPDEFEQYEAVKFLVNYGAADCVDKIINVMKKSSFAENIASELPYLVSIENLLERNFDEGILVLCNIISAMPEIIPPSVVIDYNLYDILANLYNNQLTSTSALLLRMSVDKIGSICENEEYLFDCDKNTKDEINVIDKFLRTVNINKLNSLLYEELYEESDFVFFAIDYADNIEELETLLDSKNQTLVLKVLTLLKDKNALTNFHKELALNYVTTPAIKEIIDVL